MFVVYGLAPFGTASLRGHLDCKVRKRAVLCRAVPVLHPRGDIYDVARLQRARRLAPFLIPALPGGNNQNLSPALFSIMNMPVVTARGLEGDVGD